MPRKRRSDKPDVSTSRATTASTILNDLTDSELRTMAASVLGKRRMALLTKKEHQEMSSRGGKNYWSQMSPEEVRLEQKRRSLKGVRSRRRKLRKRIGLD